MLTPQKANSSKCYLLKMLSTQIAKYLLKMLNISSNCYLLKMLTPQNVNSSKCYLNSSKCYLLKMLCYCNDFTRILLHQKDLSSLTMNDDDDDESNPKNRLSLMLMAVKK